MKKYRFLKDYKDIQAGSIAEVADEKAETLMEVGVIEVYDEAAEKAAKAQTKAIKDVVAEQIKSAVQELKASAPESDIRVRCEITHDEADDGFKNLGEFAAAVKDACAEGCGEWDPKLKAMVAKAPTGQNVTQGPEGGFLVGTDYSRELTKRAYGESVLAAGAEKVPISAGSDTLRWLDRNDYNQQDGSRKLSVYRRAEAAQFTASVGDMKENKLSLEKLTGLYYVTGEAMKDAAAVTSMMNTWFAEEFGERFDTEIYTGTGVGEMKGILNSACLVTVAKEGSQTADTVNAANIVKMYSRMHGRNLGNAKWYINQSLLPELMTMTLTTSGTERPIWTSPSTGFKDAPAGLLLGRPIVLCEQCKQIGDKGDIMFADMGQYRMIEKGGMEMASSIHLRFDYDEEAFRFIVRNNGQPKWSDVLTPKNDTTKTRSPFVVLAARA
jgi:HK97 family phage major capsid protein